MGNGSVASGKGIATLGAEKSTPFASTDHGRAGHLRVAFSL